MDAVWSVVKSVGTAFVRVVSKLWDAAIGTDSNESAYNDHNVFFESRKVTETIDLHGLTRREALDVVRKALRTRRPRSGVVNFITGRGLNSVDQKPVVKPAVEEYLRANGYYNRYWTHVGGMVSVHL